MDIVALLIALIVIGAILYCITLLPIDATIKRVIQVVAIVAVLVWLLRQFGGMLG